MKFAELDFSSSNRRVLHFTVSSIYTVTIKGDATLSQDLTTHFVSQIEKLLTR